MARDILNECVVATVTCTKEGFMTGHIFDKWLLKFSERVPRETACSIVLVMDGCGDHIMDIDIPLISFHGSKFAKRLIDLLKILQQPSGQPLVKDKVFRKCCSYFGRESTTVLA